MKFGKVCILQYGINIANFSSAHEYIRFTIPDDYKPKANQSSTGIIVSGNWALAGLCSLNINPNGNFSIISTTTQSGAYTFIGQLVYITA